MAPRSSTSIATHPYSRRNSAQPKSSRQQFSACGACRMRRVRCDLKDLPSGPDGPPTSCSNCTERGLKCVDEFAEVKTVKLLRRGRRLQQVEAIYGKSNGSEPTPPSHALPQSVIPKLQPVFFTSSFWRRFGVQRPIIDPAEFPARFEAHHNGTLALSPEGRLITMLLVVWAYSFGVDERGVEHPDPDEDAFTISPQAQDEDVTYKPFHATRREYKERTNAMVRELLQLVDGYSILRKPSWDGVRVLLLLLPLMEDAQLPLEILTMYETTLAQIGALASLTALAPPVSPHVNSAGMQGHTSDAMIKARIFWHAYVHEGTRTALHGGRLMFDEIDLDTFQRTLPLDGQLHPQQASAQAVSQLFAVPLRISTVCRQVHALLTGRDARRRAERRCPLDSDGVQRIWDGLDTCWGELNAFRRNAIGMSSEEVERYIASWQIFVFECHNIVRDALKQHIISQSPPGTRTHPAFPGHLTPPPSSAASVYRLHTLAVRRCMKLLPHVLRTIKTHLQTAGAPLFRWDTELVGDGCFFAGYLAAGGENDHPSATEDIGAFVDRVFKQEEGETGLGQTESVELSLLALREMRWCFAKAEEREQTIRMICNARRARNTVTTISDVPPHDPSPQLDLYQTRPHPHTYSQVLPVTFVRPTVPPLELNLNLPTSDILTATSGSTSAPPSGAIDPSSSWPTYTPPGTGTSGTGTSFSGSNGSPIYSSFSDPHLPFYTTKALDVSTGGEMLYQTHAGMVEMDPFSFSVPIPGYHQDRSHHDAGDTCGWRPSGQCRSF